MNHNTILQELAAWKRKLQRDELSSDSVMTLWKNKVTNPRKLIYDEIRGNLMKIRKNSPELFRGVPEPTNMQSIYQNIDVLRHSSRLANVVGLLRMGNDPDWINSGSISKNSIFGNNPGLIIPERGFRKGSITNPTAMQRLLIINHELEEIANGAKMPTNTVGNLFKAMYTKSKNNLDAVYKMQSAIHDTYGHNPGTLQDDKRIYTMLNAFYKNKQNQKSNSFDKGIRTVARKNNGDSYEISEDEIKISNTPKSKQRNQYLKDLGIDKKSVERNNKIIRNDAIKVASIAAALGISIYAARKLYKRWKQKRQQLKNN